MQVYVNIETGERHIISTENQKKIYLNNPKYELLKPKKKKVDK